MKEIIDRAVAARVEELKVQVLQRLKMKKLPDGVTVNWDREARKVMLYGDHIIQSVVEDIRTQIG